MSYETFVKTLNWCSDHISIVFDCYCFYSFCQVNLDLQLTSEITKTVIRLVNHNKAYHCLFGKLYSPIKYFCMLHMMYTEAAACYLTGNLMELLSIFLSVLKAPFNAKVSAALLPGSLRFLVLQPACLGNTVLGHGHQTDATFCGCCCHSSNKTVTWHRGYVPIQGPQPLK